MTLDRRTFLLGAGAVLLAGCAGGSDSSSAGLPGPGVDLQALFSSNNSVAAGRPERLPLGLIREGLASPDGPGSLSVEVRDDTGAVVDTVTATAYGRDRVRLYYPVMTTLPAPGIYELVTEIDGEEIVQFVQAFDPAGVLGAGAGEALPVTASPTLDDDLGVEVLCTRFPEPCDFHGTNLADVIGTGQKLAVLVATPAHCQTFWCGPILDDLIEVAAQHPDVLPIHVEVYLNIETLNGNITDPDIRLAPTVEAFGLDFEPSLYLVDGDGIVSERFDHTLDPVEMAEAFARFA